MKRSEVLVLLAFLAIVGVLGALVVPGLLGSPPRRARPALPPDVTPLPPPASAPTPPPARATPKPAPVPSEGATVRVTVADDAGSPLSADRLRLYDATLVRADGPAAVLRATSSEPWVGAPGLRWARVPAVGPDGTAHVTLERAASALAVTVREADGRPAADVPVTWAGPDGKPLDRRTDARGVVLVDDRPAGVLHLKVGGTERGGPTLRLRLGVDREALAVLDPPRVVTGRVVGEDGAPFLGARVTGRAPEGPCGRETATAADGSFRWEGRATEHLSLVARLDGREEVAVEPPLPLPRGPLVSSAEIRLPPARAAIEGRLDRTRLDASRQVDLVAEPAVAALVREAYGEREVLLEPRRRPGVEAGFSLAGLTPDVPWRVQVRGDVVPEDHVLAPSAPGARALALLPEPAAAAPPPAAPSGKEGPPGVVRGRVVDPEGRALPGLTVAGGPLRTVTNARGEFVLAGFVPGESVHLVYAWLDGADAGPMDPSAYAPWFEADTAPGPEAVALVLPRAAAVTFRPVDGLDRTPLSYVRVVVLDGEGDPRFDDLVAASAGAVTVRGLVPGTAGTLAVFAPGLRREVPLALKGGQTVDLGEVSLVHGARVEGLVRDLAGRPVAGALVAAMEDGRGDAGGRALLRERDLTLRRAVTDAAGAFVLDGLDPARPAALAIVADGYAPSARRVLWSEDGQAKLSASLARGGRLTVRILDPNGAPVSGAAVDLLDARTGARWIDLIRRAGWGSSLGSSEDVRRASRALLLEDPDHPGVYRVGPAEPGPYEVFVERPGFQSARARYTIVDPSPDSPDNPMRIPLEALEWHIELQPVPSSGR